MVSSQITHTGNPSAIAEFPSNQGEMDNLHRSLSAFVGGLIRNRIDLQFARKELDFCYISEMLKCGGGNIGRTAKMMGVHRNTLSKRIKELNIPIKSS